MHATVDWAAAGFPVASREEQARRLATCRGCEHWRDNRCLLCGCYLARKVAMKTEHCPIDKW